MTQLLPSQPPTINKALIGYLYFVQGIVLALCVTIPLTYKQLPSYTTLGYFSLATLPFSFKFITAPIIEKYSRVQYGRRKFWIVVSMMVASVVLGVISMVVNDEEKQVWTAGLLFVVGVCVSVQDISTDALGIKELRKPELSSFLQAVFQQIGIVAGSLLLGEMTSERFGKMLGFECALTSASSFILCMTPFIILPTLWIHFCFTETATQKQQTVHRLSLWQVVTHYRHFILPKYRVCRQALLFVLMFQGLTFFNAGYSIELLKSSVLTKEFTISLSNCSLVVILPLTYVVSRFVNKGNLQAVERVLFGVRVAVVALVTLVDSKDAVIAAGTLFLMQMLGSFHFYLHGIIMNSFEDSKFEGMSVTMMASMSNLGRNSSLHLSLIGQFGFRTCVVQSFWYTGLVTLALGHFQKWINKGKEEDQDYQEVIHQHSD